MRRALPCHVLPWEGATRGEHHVQCREPGLELGGHGRRMVQQHVCQQRVARRWGRRQIDLPLRLGQRRGKRRRRRAPEPGRATSWGADQVKQHLLDRPQGRELGCLLDRG